jgi:hypothetical protein
MKNHELSLRVLSVLLAIAAVTVLAGCTSMEESINSSIDLANQSIAEKNFVEARKYVSQIEELDPGNSDAIALAGLIDQLEASTSAYNQALSLISGGQLASALEQLSRVADFDVVNYEESIVLTESTLQQLIVTATEKKTIPAAEEAVSVAAKLLNSARVTIDALDPQLNELQGWYVNNILDASKKLVSQSKIQDAVTLVANARVLAFPRTQGSEWIKGRNSEELLAREVDRLDKLVIAAKERERTAALSKMRIERDSFQGISFYYDRATYSGYAGNKFQLYVGMNDGGSGYLRLLFSYFGNDWVFWHTVNIKVDGQIFTISPGFFEVTRNNGGGSVWETYDMEPTGDNIAMIQKIIQSKSAVLRFQGDDYYADRTITSAQKRAFRNVLAAYEVLR